MFPNFEQPDIRGTFKLFLAGPAKWQCRSNGFRKENFHYVDVEKCSSDFLKESHELLFSEVPQHDQGAHEVWEFCNTEEMPSYLFGVYAGDWKEVKCAKFEGKDFKFRMYCTAAQEESLKRVADEYYHIHNEGLKYFEETFGVKYPYSKYDITFVPKMSICFSACEYPGNVIYDETALEDNNSRKYSTTAFVMLHEMAHMWFGNLVNIGWWDELYLKEAMADYTSWQAYASWWGSSDANKMRYQDPTIFFAGRKTQGMYEDTCQFTSRSLKGECEYAADNVWMYSRITYGKGFSVMRELFTSLGLTGEKFGKWCNEYLTKNANGTATEEDFADAIQVVLGPGSPVNARKLCNQYFSAKGCDKIALRFSPDHNSLWITQTVAKKGQEMMPHYFDIAFYDKDCKVVSVIPVQMKEEKITIDLSSAPDWVHVMPNYNNIGYVDFELDSEQRDFFRFGANVKALDTQTLATFNQQYFFNTLRGKVSIEDYLRFAMRLVRAKPDEWMNLLCGKLFCQKLLGATSGIMNSFIKNKVYDTLKTHVLEKSKPDDVAILEYMFIYAPKSKNRAGVYKWLFENKDESWTALGNNLTMTTLKRICIKVLHSDCLKDDPATEAKLWDRLKKADLRQYRSLIPREKFKTMSPEGLREFWGTVLAGNAKESESKFELTRRREFKKQVERAGFEGGYFEEWFRNFHAFFAVHDMWNCQHYMRMCPGGNTDELLKRFYDLLSGNTWPNYEEWIIKKKIEGLQLKQLLEVTNL